ncbi:DMT family transporter [Epibacterium ulvae]|uniref:DMT family transporter n=1 Tax=Epibacterium ulvae TaxID=1156985 RepID=UPI002490393A|nr:DMT family transporter [Epibacterium ulvae]
MPQNHAPVGRAALWMVGAILSFSSMAIAGREAGSSLDTFEIMTYRSFVGVIIVCVALTLTRSWNQVRIGLFSLHMIRNLAHFTGQNLWFYAVTVIPLAQVFALEFTSPLWVLLLSPLLLGEQMTRPKVVAAALGFIGALVVAQPNSGQLNVGVITAAVSAIFFALTIITTKKLTQSEQIGSILFWLTIMQLGMGLVMAGWDGQISVPSAATSRWLLLIGCAGLTAHFCVTKALSLAPATVVVPIDFCRLPIIALLGIVLYNENVTLTLIAGSLLILVANYFNILSAVSTKTTHPTTAKSQ